ncbi:MAG: helix-turn-helix domain-containing protein [Candidatus Oxydemutatoraceae bacterium WSBS_2016_MAG_OTU14]
MSIEFNNKNNEALMEDISKFIQERRVMKNISQEHLSELSGVSKSSISRFESGKGNLSILNFIAMIKSLNLINDFMKILEPEESPLFLAKASKKYQKKKRSSRPRL